MALRHGNKIYLQLLLDPNRARLVQERARDKNIRATAWIREAIYEKLERICTASEYKEAKAKDEAVWRESVRRRVEGRNTPTEKPNEKTDSCEMP